MNPRFFRLAAVIFGVFGAAVAHASTTVISTTNYAYTGSNQSKTYTVPTGANCVTIQAWGSVGYVDASYVVSPGSNLTVTLSNSSGGSTTVQGSAGTVKDANGTCSATGSAYSVTTNPNYASGGPASPGAGNSYPGYVTITASNTLYTLSVTASPSSAGTVTGAGTYAPNTSASILETAYPGYSAIGWGGPDAGSVAASSNPSSTISMTADRTLVANFSPNVPVFSSNYSNQTLVIGTPYSLQVNASQAPVYSVTGLPPGLIMSSLGLISGTPTTIGTYTATVTASENAVAVEELGSGAGEVVTVSSSTLGNNLNVYATVLNLQLNGSAATGFCIDPWHWSVEGSPMTYDWESLAAGPKVADGMGASVALEIEQLWDQYYSAGMSDTTAAGLQIAIWDLVSASVSAQTNGAYTYAFDSSNSYGATSMIAWVEANPNAPTANLEAVTGSGQDYVTAAAGLPQSSAATASTTIPFTVYAKPVVASASATIPVSTPYSYSISATGNPISYNASGMPTGLSIANSTGLISGTPTKTGTYTINMSASNSAATGNGTLTLTVTPAYTLSITGSPAAGGVFTGAGNYSPGTVVTITETPSTGYRTAGWGGTNGSATASPSSATTTITMNGNYTLAADFVQQGTLLVSAGTGGTATGSGTYDVGTVAPICATPGSTYTFHTWSGSGVASSGAASTSVTVTGNQTVSASFTPSYTLSISGSNANGGTFTGAGSYPAGTVVTISETAAAGFRNAGWGGADASSTASSTNPSTTIVMSANRSLVADFIPQGTLTVSAGAGGTATGSGTYDVGTVVPITATPATNYLFQAWTGAGVSNAALASSSVTISGNQTVSASFLAPYTLAITGSSANGGTFAGAGTYPAGTVVSISETAAAGYRPGGWGGTDGGSTASPSSAATTIVMSANRTLVADFVQQGTLTVSAGTGGTATGSGTYDVGTVVPITATPAATYLFNAWSGTGVSNPATASSNVTVSGNETVTASFTPTYTLAISGSNANGGAFSGAGTYPAGTLVSISETAASGYRASGWGGANAGLTASASSPATTITMNGNYTLVADFVPQGTLIVSAGPGGSATGAGTYDVGTVVPITAAPAPTYLFNTWAGAGISNAATASSSVTISGNETISASFTPTYTLAITGSDPNGGTYQGGGTYAAGTVVSISENAASGYRDGGWSGADAGSTASSTSASTTITMDGNYNLVADFVQQGTLTVNAGAGGTATGSGTYDVGTVVPITATPAATYLFGAWTGTGLSSTTTAASSVTISGNETVSASFTPTYTLAITGSDPNGGGFTGAGTYAAGTVVSISETAASGYRASGWGGANAGLTASSTSPATTITVNGNYNLVADFIQQVTLTVAAGSGGTAAGGGTYDLGSTVAITGTPNAGFNFNDWTGGATANANLGSTTITLSGNETVTANFAPQPPAASLNAALTAYTGSPFNVTSAATAPADDLTLHSIEWLSPTGDWTVDSVEVSGASSNRSLGINFPTTGVWTLRAGASIDNGNTWVYSTNVQVTVTSGITSYTLQSMAVPSASALTWYSSSPVVQKTYQVQHTNPGN